MLALDLLNEVSGPAHIQVVEDRFRPQMTGVWNGLKVANNVTDAVNDVDIELGTCMSDTKNFLIQLAATHVKQIDVVFAEYIAIGTPSGGRDSADNLTGAKWFRLYLIGGAAKNDQAFISTSASPTLPTGFTEKKQIGWLYWTGSLIKLFEMTDNYVEWKDSDLSINANNPGTARVLATLLAPPKVGVQARTNVILVSAATTATILGLTSTYRTDAAPSLTAAPLAIGEVAAGVTSIIPNQEVKVDVNSQAAYRLTASDANITVRIETLGYTEDRRI